MQFSRQQGASRPPPWETKAPPEVQSSQSPIPSRSEPNAAELRSLQVIGWCWDQSPSAECWEADRIASELVVLGAL